MTATMPTGPSPTPRRMWQLLETIHAITYFAPAAREAAAPLGFDGFWPGYVTMRAAPLGTVGPALVRAIFFGFHPDRIAATLPAAWNTASPEAVLAARSGGVDLALRELWGPGGTGVAAAADLAWAAAEQADVAGRPLAAANQALPRPADAHLALWQAATTLREHRGDGHVAVLTAHGISPVETMLFKVGAGESEAEPLRLGRKWPRAEWDAVTAQVRARGLIDADGRLTTSGAAVHHEVEAATDDAARVPWQRLGGAATDDLERLLTPLAGRVVAAGLLPEPNPIGLPLPSARTG